MVVSQYGQQLLVKDIRPKCAVYCLYGLRIWLGYVRVKLTQTCRNFLHDALRGVLFFCQPRAHYTQGDQFCMGCIS